MSFSNIQAQIEQAQKQAQGQFQTVRDQAQAVVQNFVPATATISPPPATQPPVTQPAATTAP